MTEVTIKPHHFLDIIKLYGAGITCFVRDETYQHDFYRIANLVLADHQLPVRLTVHGDDICLPCRYYSRQGEGVCSDSIAHIPDLASKDEWNKILDNRIIRMVVPDSGAVYTAEEFCRLLYDHRDDIYEIWKEDDAGKTKERFRLFCAGAVRYLGLNAGIAGEHQEIRDNEVAGDAD